MMAMNSGDNNNEVDLKTCVVLGGRGLIGRSVVDRLLKLGNWIVRVADSTQSTELDESSVSDSFLSRAMASGRALYLHVDVRNKDQIVKAVEGAVTVFFTDSMESNGDDFYIFYSIIVEGIKNVIDACRQCKVKQLIYNGPADVVYASARHIHNGDESLPYDGRFGSMLTDLKAQAEAMVLFANDIDGLLTCVIRCSNVFGPGDKYFVPLLVHMAKTGWTKFIIGTAGENMSDFTYVENVAYANICAEEALGSRVVSVSGKVFLITNLEPMKFWEFVSLILDGLGYQRPMIKLPAIVVKYIISLLKVMQVKIDFTSVHYIFELSSCTRTFNCSAAQKHIGYSPIVSLEEGITRTVESFSYLAQDSILLTRNGNFSEESKANKFLGNGKVADILLWRNEKTTFTYFLSLVLLYYWFFLCGRTLISSVTKLLLVATILLSGYRFLPPNLPGITIPRIQSSCFEISETVAIESVSFLAYAWNEGCHLVESLAQGEDWSTFLVIVGLLYSLKVIVSCSLTVAIGVAIVLAFTIFYIYEQYEDEIDGAAKSLSSQVRKGIRWLLRNLPSSLASLISDRKEALGKQHFSTKHQY
ncbi:hypothetical protein M9H77_30117 [Catharanthus roseus]|uniref:Uncharacterized protein n=1 Tax=Catharanthus roseus TaxID=4058 RepID=A0ACB9ZWC9_CATRO|nr:hypothetical protein M9H77_30117 [Catharanthus roseus]